MTPSSRPPSGRGNVAWTMPRTSGPSRRLAREHRPPAEAPGRHRQGTPDRGRLVPVFLWVATAGAGSLSPDEAAAQVEKATVCGLAASSKFAYAPRSLRDLRSGTRTALAR